MLEKLGMAALASKVVFVAGHRVTTDPLAIPFSMGCNLLCIFSKKYMEEPPELKAAKQQQNMVGTPAPFYSTTPAKERERARKLSLVGEKLCTTGVKLR
jgi:hypothetical protein